MKKHIVFGGFDYAVRWEMNQEAIFQGVDYFVDNDPDLIGTTYLGKPIYGTEQLLKEEIGSFIVLIGSVVYHTELELQLNDMGFEKNKDYIWGPAWSGDEKCPPLWYRKEWRNDSYARTHTETGEEPRAKYEIVSRLINSIDINTVIELGAANERIREFLPGKIKYIPVDYIKYSDDTIVLDLNKEEIPRIPCDRDKTCCVIVGTLQYMKEWRHVLQRASGMCDHFVITHNDFVRVSREFRRQSLTWNTAFFNHDLILEMQNLGFEMKQAYDFRLRIDIMRFERRIKL